MSLPSYHTGLGKTLCVIALAVAHQRPEDETTLPEQVPAEFRGYAGVPDPSLPPSAGPKKKSGGARQRRSLRTRRGGAADAGQGEEDEDEQALPDVDALPTLNSKATLVVIPPPLLTQWQAEVQRHAPFLNVMVYEGNCTAWARDFCDADIVLTTYSVCSKELRTHGPLRHSPMFHVSWWRIVLDEAQLVASGASQAARMCCFLQRVNSWCSTGTPFSKGNPSELEGPLAFLDMEPFASADRSFRHLANHAKSSSYAIRVLAFTAMRNLLDDVMWRNTKADVENEIVLPTCTHRNVYVPLNPHETAIYQHQVAVAKSNLATVAAFRGGGDVDADGDDDMGRGSAKAKKAAKKISSQASLTTLNTLLRLRTTAAHVHFANTSTSSRGPDFTGRDAEHTAPEMAWWKSRQDKEKERKGKALALVHDLMGCARACLVDSPYEALTYLDRVLVCLDSIKRWLGMPWNTDYSATDTRTRRLALVEHEALELLTLNLYPLLFAITPASTTLQSDVVAGTAIASIVASPATIHEQQPQRQTPQPPRHKVQGEEDDAMDALPPPNVALDLTPPNTWWREDSTLADRLLVLGLIAEAFAKDAAEELKNRITLTAQLRSGRTINGAQSQSQPQPQPQQQQSSSSSSSSSGASFASPPGPQASLAEQTIELFSSEYDHARRARLMESSKRTLARSEAAMLGCLVEVDILANLHHERSTSAQFHAADSTQCVEAEVQVGESRFFEVEALEPVANVYGSKAAALVSYLQSIGPHEKCVVFSTWNAMLDVAATALDAHGITHLSFAKAGSKSGRKAVGDWQSDPTVQVLFIPLRSNSGAAGLTLTQACHALLMEPSLDHGLEAQARARVHRLGQMRPVEVVTLVAQDTIENNMVTTAASTAVQGDAQARVTQLLRMIT